MLTVRVRTIKVLLTYACRNISALDVLNNAFQGNDDEDTDRETVTRSPMYVHWLPGLTHTGGEQHRVIES